MDHSLPDLLASVEKPMATAVATALLFIVSTVLGCWLIAEARSPLRKYPGPFLSRWTNLWRLALVRTDSYHIHMKQLHDKYGPVVRIGPNLLDLDTPELAKTIYTTDISWRKTEFYKNSSTVINGNTTYTLFSEIDPARHAQLKRPVANFFLQGSILKKETLMEGALRDMCIHLENRFQGKNCDLGEWISFCAWDIVGAVSFNQTFGYMDKGFDFDGSIGIADQTMDYFSAVGQMPFLDHLFDKNPIVRIGPPNLGNITGVAVRNLAMRVQAKESTSCNVPDFLDNYLDVKRSHPGMTDTDVITYLLTALIAGADTTAIAIRAIFYYALKTPSVFKKLEDEILVADLGEVASYSTARALPYLEATVREAMRMHPSICMLMERYVPNSGLTLPDGSHVPAGTAVGINPYVLCRNRDVWGADADEFRPERWLRDETETEQQYRDRMKAFNAADLTFGGGARICIGRYMALLEIYKLVPTLITHFEIEMVDPKREWEVFGRWFTRQKGLICNLKRRA
ncbi:cytochrome P450 [Xylariaceae sp. FL0662B]|nr:cytochrome P450 [Xylariaceae sp. FL0662B]